jgi:hypothetical protein
MMKTNNYLILNYLISIIKSAALTIVLLTSNIGILQGQDYKIGNPIQFFTDHQMLEIAIKADFQTILKDVGDERNEHSGQLQYISGNDTLIFDIQLMTRGNFRRSPDNCSFPPLRINFKKKQVRNSLFDGLDKVKLVTHCRPKAKAYQNYVLEEFLIYRAFNIITDTSFRVRLLKVDYIDVPSGKHSQQSFAFFIEPDKVLEERLNLKESEQKYLLQDSTQYHHISRLAIFQYMIGNTDWAVTTLQNIKLFEPDSLSRPYAIPYDFDWSGAIQTVYSRPLPRFELESVRERLFRGYCRTMDELTMNFSFFEDKKEDIYNLYKNFEPLNNRRRKNVLKYYDEFFKIIQNDRRIESEFLMNCLK